MVLTISLCEVNTADRQFRNLVSASSPYPAPLREKILSIAQSGVIDLRELMGLSSYLGHLYADSIRDFLTANDIDRKRVDLIGLHGQTIAHLSSPIKVMERSCLGTLQIGEAEVIAKKLGIVTVSDFRSADIALDGSGAPLVPIYHQLRFAEPEGSRAVVNIGGVANVTLLNGTSECLATDSGPGNCLIDTAAQKLYGIPFDKDGELSLAGSVNEKLLQEILQDPLLGRKLPTSYDRGELVNLLQKYSVLDADSAETKAAVMATMAQLTVNCLRRALMQLGRSKLPDQILVCGGGVHNGYLMLQLQNSLTPSKVTSTATFGSNPDFVESEAFAHLANLTIDGLAGNLPAVTQASRAAVLGKISQP